ncbi:Stage III sporulation protein AH [Paenibacillus sp. CECT 9249]|uniref:SpoIIIAH-like family protein n=1 Tax=Paenibacillus sp. CECT 9249 TaxID=2845385 RepID=UPI001E28479D|nr:SpoIIIAH-like family protein [Paenibacillus sp. CECT 9249]CAH0118598.1 Stage III sporulation protein AH [Paenibacillus sp. CECT 9249]
MNSKRQTIWLVSMLSIMVILSAYYLFTDPSGSKESNQLADGTQLTNDMIMPNGTDNGNGANDVIVDEVLDPNADPTSEPSESKSDQDVLKQMENQGASSKDYITKLQMNRNDENQKKMEELQSIVNDMEKSPADAGKATEEMMKLEEKEQKITSVEETLQKEFGDAVITQDNDKYKVVVQSKQLEVSQAVSIIDLVMKELNVTQDKVSVQRVSP